VQLSGYSTTSGSALLATFSGIEAAVGTNFDDALIGDAAGNNLIGGAGSDWLVGNAGADAFIYLSAASGDDIIADFSRADLDRIDLSAIDADPTQAGDQFFTLATQRTSGAAGQAVVENFGASSLVSLYLDADNVADMTIQVVHQAGLIMNAGDFVL
jgi:Ca2+-binding RTX toxin-like protein